MVKSSLLCTTIVRRTTLLDGTTQYFLLFILQILYLIPEIPFLSNKIMLFLHELVHLTLSVFTKSELPVAGLNMLVKLVPFFLDNNLSLEELRVIMKQGTL